MDRIGHLDEIDELHATTFIVPRGGAGYGVAARDEMLNEVTHRMAESMEAGRPFIVSDGERPLVVAMPGEPLKVVTDGGKLHEALGQDLPAIIRSLG